MQIEAKDIESLLPPIISEGTIVSGLNNGRECDAYIEGFNTAIKRLSTKKLEVVIDREKLADIIYESMGGVASELNRHGCVLLSDAIIAKTDNGLVKIVCGKE